MKPINYKKGTGIVMYIRSYDVETLKAVPVEFVATIVGTDNRLVYNQERDVFAVVHLSELLTEPEAKKLNRDVMFETVLTKLRETPRLSLRKLERIRDIIDQKEDE